MHALTRFRSAVPQTRKREAEASRLYRTIPRVEPLDGLAPVRGGEPWMSIASPATQRGGDGDFESGRGLSGWRGADPIGAG